MTTIDTIYRQRCATINDEIRWHDRATQIEWTAAHIVSTGGPAMLDYDEARKLLDNIADIHAWSRDLASDLAIELNAIEEASWGAS